MFSDVLFLFYLSQVDFTTSQPDFHAAQQCELRTCELGDDVRRDLVFDESDAVAQQQFALFQPLQSQQIRGRRLMQCIDRSIQITVLLLQPCELGMQLALIFVGHDVR